MVQLVRKVFNIISCTDTTFKVYCMKTRDIIWDLWLKVLSIPTLMFLVYAFYPNYPDAPLLIPTICAGFVWGLLWLLFAATYALDVLLEDKT